MASTKTATVSVLKQQPAHIPPAGFKRNIVESFDVPGTKYETVLVFAELTANAATGRHQHPGIESGYVVAGSGKMFADGQPPIELRAGQAYRIPFNAKHEMQSGANGMTVVATWILEKGKPVATAVI